MRTFLKSLIGLAAAVAFGSASAQTVLQMARVYGPGNI